MKTYTIGYIREDGDLAILATLNNNDEHLSDDAFKGLAYHIKRQLACYLSEDVLILEREDSPDYADLEP